MAITARELAERLEISERSVYRDIRDLMASGVPIDGAAGVGYVLRRGFDLPPLMFTREEIEALVVGARLVMSWTDGKLARAAEKELAALAMSGTSLQFELTPAEWSENGSEQVRILVAPTRGEELTPG